MLDRAYRKRLAAELPKWRDAGWVTPDGATAILSAQPAGRDTFGLATVVGMFGGLLVGVGVIAFISANWQEIPRVTRLGLLAAGIVLVGQSYHLSGEFADAVALWLIGIFGAAAMTGSPTMTALGLLGGAFWTYTVTVDSGVTPHWAGLAPVLVGATIATVVASRNARLLSVFAFIFWAVLAIGAAGDQHDWPFAGSIALGVAAGLALFALGAAIAGIANERLAALGRDAQWPALAATLIGLGIEQAADHPSVGE